MENTFDEKAAMKLGRSKNTSADVLKTLVGKSVEVDRLIAKHPNADVAALYKLSGNNDKITSENILESLNIEKLLIAKPNAILLMGKEVGSDWLRYQLKHPDVPQYLVDWAINKQTDRNMACGALFQLWANPSIPDEVFKADKDDKSEPFRILNGQISDLEDAKARGKFLADLGLDVKMVVTPADRKEYWRCGYVMSLAACLASTIKKS